jgi:hypothetical protein
MGRIIRAPRGTTLHCKGWGQEAAMRMLMNNLDPEVAGDPEHLIVYGGSGKAARNWESFDIKTTFIHLIGRINSFLLLPHLIDLPKFNESKNSSTIAGKSSFDFFPFTSFLIYKNS